LRYLESRGRVCAVGSHGTGVMETNAIGPNSLE
jgi:hypothetical protein